MQANQLSPQNIIRDHETVVLDRTDWLLLAAYEGSQPAPPSNNCAPAGRPRRLQGQHAGTKLHGAAAGGGGRPQSRQRLQQQEGRDGVCGAGGARWGAGALPASPAEPAGALQPHATAPAARTRLTALPRPAAAAASVSGEPSPAVLEIIRDADGFCFDVDSTL